MDSRHLFYPNFSTADNVGKSVRNTAIVFQPVRRENIDLLVPRTRGSNGLIATRY
jgi:hypothetical protein